MNFHPVTIAQETRALSYVPAIFRVRVPGVALVCIMSVLLFFEVVEVFLQEFFSSLTFSPLFELFTKNSIRNI